MHERIINYCHRNSHPWSSREQTKPNHTREEDYFYVRTLFYMQKHLVCKVKQLLGLFSVEMGKYNFVLRAPTLSSSLRHKTKEQQKAPFLEAT